MHKYAQLHSCGNVHILCVLLCYTYCSYRRIQNCIFSWFSFSNNTEIQRYFIFVSDISTRPRKKTFRKKIPTLTSGAVHFQLFLIVFCPVTHFRKPFLELKKLVSDYPVLKLSSVRSAQQNFDFRLP